MLSGNGFIAFGAAFRSDRRLRFILLFLIMCAAAVGTVGCGGGKSAPVLEEYIPADPSEREEADADGSETGDPAPVHASSDLAGPASSSVAAESAVSSGSVPQAPAGGTITVHVCGAVKKEGVYTLPAGSRIRDAVEAAGGFSEKADTAYLNLALAVEDAWQIRVPTREETDALRGGNDPATVYGAGSAAASGPAQPGAGAEDKAGSGPDHTGQPGTGVLRGSGEDTGAGLAPDGAPKVDLNSASKEDLMRIPGIGESKALRILEYREQHGRFEEIEDLMKIPGIKNASFQKMKEYIKVNNTVDTVFFTPVFCINTCT